MPLTAGRASEFSGDEETRIRDVYARRQGSSRGIYSFSNPSYVLQIQERELELLSMFSHCGVGPLEASKVLEIGCGSGHWLRAFLQWGALPGNVFGIDLLSERIEQARRLCPRGVHLECGNAMALPFPAAFFDLVLQSTVFTSILDVRMRQGVAAEMLRVLKPGGLIVWYDFYVNNPKNPDVRAVGESEICQLFPGTHVELRRVTLAPPIGRLVGRYSRLLYMLLSSVKILSTHYLCLIKKN